MRPCLQNPLPALLVLGALMIAGCGSSPGPDRSATRTEGNTGLMQAAADGKREEVAYESPDGRTALDVARANGNRDLVMMLSNAGGD